MDEFCFEIGPCVCLFCVHVLNSDGFTCTKQMKAYVHKNECTPRVKGENGALFYGIKGRDLGHVWFRVKQTE